MSFNFQEVARGAQEIRERLIASDASDSIVEAVDLLEFPLPCLVPDLNIGIRFRRQYLVLSLKQPWVGVFVTDTQKWKVSRRTWADAFGGALPWASALVGQSLVNVAVKANDRVLDLHFENGTVLSFDLFPGRPNWHLKLPQAPVASWRAALAPTQNKVPPRPAAAAGSSAAAIKDRFEGLGGDWSAAAYQHYFNLRRTFALDSIKQKGLSALRSRLLKMRRIQGDLEESWEESKKADLVKSWGELLKTAIHEHPRDFRSDGIDIYGSHIPLNPQLSLSENLLHFFTRYKKLQRTAREVGLRRKNLEQELERTRELVKSFETFKPEGGFGSDFLRLKELVSRAGVALPRFFLVGDETAASKKGPSKHDKKWQKSGLKSFRSKEGLMIWVGRNHAENAELVIRLAKGNDLWFHLKGRPGAHVIVQLPQGKTASLETMLDASCLVAYYSSIADGEKVEVDYTFRKYVKRVAGKQEAFLVTFSQNKTIVVKVEKDRLERLLGQINEIIV